MSLEPLIADAIKLLQKHEPPEGYYVAFSGGKDSIVIYDLVKRAGVKHGVYFNQTTIDPPEIYQFIRQYYPEVIWEKPKKSMFMLIKTRACPPSRRIRYCCSELKEIHGTGRVVVTGVRRSESVNRRTRQEYEVSKRNPKTRYCNPIVTWSEKDVWEYIRMNNLPYPSLYDEGYTRIGCIMCPLQGYKGILLDAIRYPKHYNAYLKAFEIMLENSKRKFKGNLKWQTPEDVMFWFIYGVHRTANNYPKHWLLPTEEGFDFEKIKRG